MPLNFGQQTHERTYSITELTIMQIKYGQHRICKRDYVHEYVGQNTYSRRVAATTNTNPYVNK